VPKSGNRASRSHSALSGVPARCRRGSMCARDPDKEGSLRLERCAGLLLRKSGKVREHSGSTEDYERVRPGVASPMLGY
jgi:hypothetical protein